MSVRFCLLSVFFISLSVESLATVRTVRQDGSGDFTTIGAAVAVATAGDVIEVGPGVYPEKVDVYVTLSFVSTDGAAATIVDGEDIHYPLWFRGGTGHQVDGFTFRNGYHVSGGGAIRCQAGATLTIRNSILEDNVSDYDGGGFFTRDSGSRIDAYDCIFRRNYAARNAGAGIAILSSRITYTRCSFFDNTAGVLSAGVTADHSTMDVTNCLFVGNVSQTIAAVYYYMSSGNVVGNTFSANAGDEYGSVLIQSSSGTNVTRNIFSGDSQGAGLAYSGSGSHSCNVYYSNVGGPIIGASLNATEVQGDPLFCDAPNGNYAVAGNSPATPANSPCGLLVGAFEEGCSPIVPTTHRVRQDGSGDFLTIGEAVAASHGGDVIEVGPGVYEEQVDVYSRLTFVSTDGAATTIVDGEDTHYPLWFRGGTGHVVDGFTFRNGFHVSGGGAIRCQGGATLMIRNCILEDNVSEYDGGAFFTRDTGAFIDAYDCTFRRNHAEHNAGAGIAILGSRINYTRCSFFENTAGVLSGAVTADQSSMDVTDCLFVGNVSPTVAAVYYHLSAGNVVGNTITANSSDEHGSVLIQLSSAASVVRNIIHGDTQGAGLVYLYESGAHSCNVLAGNADGSIVGDDLDDSDVEADPVFCDAANGDYTISIQSPAAPDQSACGQLVGAFATNCDISPPPPPVVGPVILSIADVPNDEGLQVRIRWQRAQYDAPQQPYVITGYAVYRKQYDDNARFAKPDVAAGRGKDVAIDGWDYITTVPARGDNIYQVVAPTLCDLKHGNNTCHSIFFVSAMTPNPLVFFDSAPDTGQSEDNTPPGQPGALTVDVTAAGVTLAWEPADALDVVEYFVYRTYDSEELGEPVHTTSSLTWVDPNGSALARYWVAAVDDAGNIGEAITSDPSTGAGPIVPSSYYLGQNAPNPFNPSTTIEFGLPAGAGGNVTIDVFDVAGRRVRALLNESRGAGTWRVTWDGTTDAGTRASSGVYFYRLRTSTFTQTHRMTLVE